MTFAAMSVSKMSASPTTTTLPVLHHINAARAARRDDRARRRDRRGQIHARAFAHALLRIRRPARSSSTGNRCAISRRTRCATRWAWSRRRAFFLTARSATTCASANPARRDAEMLGRAHVGERARFCRSAPGRAWHLGWRARGEAERRAKSSASRSRALC